jgi:hypothetical protein
MRSPPPRESLSAIERSEIPTPRDSSGSALRSPALAPPRAESAACLSPSQARKRAGLGISSHKSPKPCKGGIPFCTQALEPKFPLIEPLIEFLTDLGRQPGNFTHPARPAQRSQAKADLISLRASMAMAGPPAVAKRRRAEVAVRQLLRLALMVFLFASGDSFFMLTPAIIQEAKNPPRDFFCTFQSSRSQRLMRLAPRPKGAIRRVCHLAECEARPTRSIAGKFTRLSWRSCSNPVMGWPVYSKTAPVIPFPPAPMHRGWKTEKGRGNAAAAMT